MKEAQFQQEIKKSIVEQGEGDGGWSEKFPDTPNYGSTCKSCGAETGGMRFVPVKKFDLICKYAGKPFAIEAKMLDGYKALSLSRFQSSKEKKNDIAWWMWNQVKSLVDFEDSHGSTAWVFLNIRNGETRTNDLIIFPIAEIINYFEAGQKSIKKVDLLEYPAIKGSKSRFDLTEFLSKL